MNGEVKFFCENSKKNSFGGEGAGRVGLGAGVRVDVTEK